MCFHNSIHKKAKVIQNRYKANFLNAEIFVPIYHGNGFNFPKWPVITYDKKDCIQLFDWGLIPSWVKSKGQATEIKLNTLNARSETVFEKPSFRVAAKKNRCIVPSTGFFEWQTLNNKKYPFFIYPEQDDFFSFAGIWEEWLDKETGELIKTFSILTTQANPLLTKIHNTKQRMPVILPEHLESDWLNPNISQEDVMAFCIPFDAKLMKAHTVSRLITSRTELSNVPGVQEEYKYVELV
ncbi:MAG: SOS response-associated peptidase [Bacteroidetes bacterium]|nr:SOS response-associated peptidase [Bacteroidota bacterium]HET6244849.1 SOS response-associated peptidase [Bacteroidia bacterium]